MHFDEASGDLIYKVAVSEAHDGGYFIVMSKINGGAVSIEFGSKHTDGTSGNRYAIEENHTPTGADKVIKKLMKGLNAHKLRWLQKEKWEVWDFTPWEYLGAQLLHGESLGWRLESGQG